MSTYYFPHSNPIIFSFTDPTTHAIEFHLRLHETLLEGKYFTHDGIGTTRFFSARLIVAVVFGLAAATAGMVLGSTYIINNTIPYLTEKISTAVALYVARQTFDGPTLPFNLHLNMSSSNVEINDQAKQLYDSQLGGIKSVTVAATTVGSIISFIFSVLAQARLLRSFRRDVLRTMYWQNRSEKQRMLEAEPMDVDPIPNPLHGKSLTLAAAPLLFGYALMNTLFFAAVVFICWVVVHLGFGVDLFRYFLGRLFTPVLRWILLHSFSLFTVLLRFFFFWFVHVITPNKAHITQYRWVRNFQVRFCFHRLLD